jgi:hypothetical protein
MVGLGQWEQVLVDLMSMLARHIETLFTLSVDGVDQSARRAKLGNGTEDVFIVHFCVLVH